ncbi:MAG: hypothetical protein KDD92_16860 [Caldilineaceae bacterium]|nr:hypothetical protein [Caldilineaceae bacterium]
MGRRVSDYALLLGHAWRCPECRVALLGNPAVTWIGFKLSEDQRERILAMDDDAYQTVEALALAADLSMDELYEAIDHPRARLRHLGSTRGDGFYINRQIDR